MSLLEVKNLCKSFTRDGNSFSAVDDVNLQINSGDCLGLVGESGCGKSTIAQLITGLLKKDSGQINFMDVDITNSKEIKKLRKNLQMVFQNPTDSFDPRYTLLNSVKQGVKSFGKYSSTELNDLAKAALDYVGLKEAYHNLPVSKLSGGECQRAAIARAIVVEPKLIICDEATSSLDVSVQAQIINLLQKLIVEKKTALLFITHDLALASSICSRIAVMYQGSIVEYGQTSDILASPKHPYTKMLLSCVLPISKNEEFIFPDCDILNIQPVNGCKFYEYCNCAVQKCINERPILTRCNEESDRMTACFIY